MVAENLAAAYTKPFEHTTRITLGSCASFDGESASGGVSL